MPAKNSKSLYDLVLDDLRVMTGEGLRKTERSDQPGFVVAPNQAGDTAQQHGSRQQEPVPEQRCQMQGLAQLGTTYQQDKESGEAVVKLRLGHALSRALPRTNTRPMMIVIEWMPSFAKLVIERSRADKQHRTENSQDDRRPHTRCLDFRPR